MTLGMALAASEPVRVAREAIAEEQAWLVGGAVRDALLGREIADVDLAVAPGKERELAQRISAAGGGHAFVFSHQWRTWRVVPPGGGWQVDLTPLHGPEGGGEQVSIEDDLRGRDFTVNAMAMALSATGPVAVPDQLIDPCGGLDDLEARSLQVASPESFSRDPLRVLRAARFAAELGFEVAGPSAELARAEAARAGEPAGERQFVELRALVGGADPVRGLAVLDELRATPAILPELHALRGVGQNPYHHLDVHGHTIEVLKRLLELEHDLEPYAGEHAAELAAILAEPLADELTRGQALRFGALFHDLGKPATRRVGEDGRVLFLGHDQVGAEIVSGLCRRLRTSNRLSSYLEDICRHHLLLGFLVHSRPLSRRATYDYLVTTAPDSACVTLLTIADRLATQGERTRREAIEAHLELARELVGEALAWRRRGPPKPAIRGDELAAELQIDPGPELGRLLRELEAAAFTGEATTREQALAVARRLVQDTDAAG